MSEKLASKHKNSLALNENKFLQERNGSKNCSRRCRPSQLTLFFIITCCIFLSYWFVLCPLLYNTLHVSYKSVNAKHWPVLWRCLYLLGAFAIWILIMLILIAIWRYLKSKYNSDDTKLKSYGSGGSEGAVYLKNTQYEHPENIKSRSIDESDGLIDSNSDIKKIKVTNDKDRDIIDSDEIRRNEAKFYKDLSPLIIHHYTSSNDIDNIGSEKLGEMDQDNINEEFINSERKGSNANRDSIKDYLQLVTVTPLEDDADIIKSPNAPLSPRDLFFIDLIREAEKADRDNAKNNSDVRGRNHFFPNDFSPTNVADTNKDLQTEGKYSTENCDSVPSCTANEATYFIANVKSPKNEKTEIFLNIEPDSNLTKEWTVDMTEEQPTLVTENNRETEADNKSQDKVIIFKV